MKNNFWLSNILRVSILVVGFMVHSNLANAQGPIDPSFPDPDTPIDGGISILIAAGVGYGIKKYRNERKKSLPKV
jgi:hypothetical protein